MAKKKTPLANWTKVSSYILAKWTKLSSLIKVLVPIIVLITFGYLLYDRYAKGKIVVEFNENNVSALPIYGSTGFKKDDGALSIGIYDIKIKNLTKRTKTIKSVQLKYEFNSKEYIIDSHVIRTGAKNPNVGTIVVRNSKGNPTFTVIGWKNLRNEIYKYQPLSAEGILDGSVIYVLLTCKMSDYENIENVEFLITDSKNNVYKQKLELKEKYTQGAKKGYFFSNIN